MYFSHRRPINPSLFLVFFLAFIGPIFKSAATHIVGADMSYRAIGNNKYIFTLNVYRDCGSTIPLENRQTVYYYSINCNKAQDSLVLSALNEGVGIDISPVCSKQKSNCKGGTTPGVEKYIFTDTVALTASCTDWIFYYKECNRSAGITTVKDPQFKCLYIEARLNNLDAPNNSSPSFQNEPVSFVCLGKPSQLNNGAVEGDGDNLKFKLIAPRTNSALPGQPDDNFLVYKSPYSATSPLPTSNGFNFDSTTGTMSFTATQQIRTVTALLVNEYRNGKLIGSVMRDLQILVQTCNNNIPTLKGINGSSSFAANVCVGQPNTLYFPGSDPDPNDSVRISWNNAIPNATFFSTYSKRRDSARFTWSPTLADTGIRIITLTIVDNSCPTIGSSSASYQLNVKPSPKVGLRSDTSLNCGVTIPVTAQILAGLPPFSIRWSGLPDTTATVQLGNGSYTVTLKDANGCTARDNLNILGGSNTTANISIDSLCVNQSATLKATLSGQPSGVTFTYQWKITPTTPEFSSSLAQPTYKFTQPGDYEIYLKITGSNNCTYTTTKTITVCSPPQVDFSLVEVPCLGQPVKINLNSSASPSCPLIDWRIRYNTLTFNASGNLATLISDSFKVGNNTVTIIGRTAAGCNVSKPFTFQVTARPGVKFVKSSVPFRCDQPKTSITFKAWKPSGLPLETYNLDIQCPDTSYLTDFFSQDTVYITVKVKKPQTITVKAKMAGSTCVTTASGTVIFPISASASASTYCREGDSTRFASNPISPWGIRNFYWDLGDGTNAFIPNPVKLYPLGQQIPVRLFLEDSSSCKDTIDFNVDTRLPDTLASVTPDTICYNTPFNFFYTNPLLVTSWTWRGVSDSITVSGASQKDGKLTLKKEGINPVSVRIKYKGVCQKKWLVDSVFVRRRVNVDMALSNVCAYDSTRFSGSQVNGEWPITSWIWKHTWRDSANLYSIPNDTGQFVSRLFNKGLRLRTKLWAVNSKGCADSTILDTGMVLVSTPAFDISGQCQGDSLFFFFGKVPDRYENIKRFSYDFGDGASTVNENGFAFHEYEQIGVYRVKLIAYSKEGCLNIDSTNLTIKPRPTVNYTTGLFPCVNSIIPLDASASTPAAGPNESIVSRRWWSDTTIISTTALASTSFSTPGLHRVAHWIQSTNGCTDSLRYWLRVLPAPTAGFDADPDQLLENDFLTFTNTATGASKWRYVYGDGKEDIFTDPAQASPLHYYTSGGAFDVLQIVTNEDGCSDTATIALRLKPYIALPSAFTPNGDNQNDGFVLRHRLIRKIDEYKVFNRFGQVVFETSDLAKAWDGKQNGNEAPAGSYVFVVKATSVFGENLTTTGTVNLIR